MERYFALDPQERCKNAQNASEKLPGTFRAKVHADERGRLARARLAGAVEHGRQHDRFVPFQLLGGKRKRTPILLHGCEHDTFCVF